jgi:hypothetical protein
MKILLAIGGLVLAGAAIALLLVRRARRSPCNQETPREAGDEFRGYAEARVRVEEEARIAAEQEAQRRVQEEARRRAGEEDEENVSPPRDEAVRSSRGERGRRGTQYRPPRPGPRSRQGATYSDTENGDAETGQKRATEIELRVLFERGGYCKVSLLPRRPEGLPEECTLSTNTGSIDIIALDDEWYQDVAPDGLGGLLRTGIVWTENSTGQEWLLSGREIFILGTGTIHRGFVSCPRMVLGREHAVLCTTSTLHAVEEVLREAGCESWKQLREDDGAPHGWVILSDVDNGGRVRGLVPQRPVPAADAADILNALRPHPEIEIALEGGVSLGYSSWLAGYPPAIRVYGDPEHTQRVLIDRQEAVVSDQGSHTAPGWDEPGTHQVWCNIASKAYSLVRLERSWKTWAAYSFPSPPSPDDSGAGNRIAICGPLVRAFADAEAFGEDAHQREIIRVLPSNPILLGAIPGQVFEFVPRLDVRGALCMASPWFSPVWALPANPLVCDKHATRILLVVMRPCNAATGPHPKNPGAFYRWCKLILDAGRKGLAVEPSTSAAVELWREYKRQARELWRRTR